MKKLSSEIHSTQSAHVQNGKETRHLFIKPVQIWESVWEQLNSCSSPESQTYPVTTGAIFHKLSPKLQDSRDPLSQTLPAAETTEQTGDWRSEGERERGRVTRTEQGGQGEWKKRADTTTTGVGNSSNLARGGKLSPYSWVSEARGIARLVRSAADGCFTVLKQCLPAHK